MSIRHYGHQIHKHHSRRPSLAYGEDAETGRVQGKELSVSQATRTRPGEKIIVRDDGRSRFTGFTSLTRINCFQSDPRLSLQASHTVMLSPILHSDDDGDLIWMRFIVANRSAIHLYLLQVVLVETLSVSRRRCPEMSQLGLRSSEVHTVFRLTRGFSRIITPCINDDLDRKLKWSEKRSIHVGVGRRGGNFLCCGSFNAASC